MYWAKVSGPDDRIRDERRSRSFRRSRAPARRSGRPDLRRPRRVVAVERNVLGGLPRPRDGELFLREHGPAEARVRRHLEVRRLAERAVRAHLDAVAAVDTADNVELVGLEVALPHHQSAGRAGLGARAAGHAVGVLERHVPRRRDDRVVATAHEAVAVRSDDVAADADALRAVDALVEVPKDEVVAEVVLVIVVVDRLGAVEAVVGQTVLERQPLEVGAADVGTDALQAAGGFLLGGVLVVPVLDELEAELALLEGEHGHAHLRLLGLVRDDVDELGHRLFLRDLLGDAGHVVAREIAIDRLRSKLPLRDALDDGARPHLDVAAREDPGAIRHERSVGDDGLPFGLANTLLAIEEVEVRHLADRGYRRVAVDNEVRAFDRDGAAPAGGVRLAEGHPLELDAADAAVLFDEPDRRGEELEADALVLRVVDLAVMRTHLLARAAVHNGHVRAQAPRGSRAVERREPTPDDHDFLSLADGNRVALGVHAEVVDRFDDAREVLPGDAQLVRAPRAQTEEHRVVALREEVVEREIAAEHHPAHELRVAQLPDGVQLLVELHLWQAIFRNAVARDAALLLHHVDNRDRVALERGVVGRGHPRRTGTDHGDALAGRHSLRERCRRCLHLHDQLAGEPVALADGDLFLDEPAAAHFLAGLRADEAEHVRERQDLFDQTRGLDMLALRHELEIPGDVDVRRAAHLARRHAVRVVVAEDVLEVLPAELEQRIRGLRDLHARLDRQVARRHRPVITLDLHEAHAAGGRGCELF